MENQTENLPFLKTKLEELQNVLKQNLSAQKEVAENIRIAQENKEKLDDNIKELRGNINGIQFSINNYYAQNSEDASKLNSTGE